MGFVRESRYISNCRKTGQVIGWVTVAAGCLVLLGWILNLPLLKSIVPGFETMKANTALCFVLLGASLAFLRPESSTNRNSISPWLAAPAIIIGLLTASQYIFNFSLGLDQIVVPDTAISQNATPGRMSLATAFSFTLLGIALLLLQPRMRRGQLTGQALTAIGGLAGLLALVGYLYDIRALYTFGPFNSMALHTSLLFVVLAVGGLLSRPHLGMMSTLTSPYTGGRMARRLLPIAVVFPFVAGLLWVRGQQAGAYDPGLGITLITTANIAAFTCAVWLAARSLNKLDVSREATEHHNKHLASIVESCDDAIISRTPQGEIISWNPAAHRLYGYSPEEAIGQDMSLIEASSAEQSARPGHGGHFEVLRRTKDDRLLQVALTASPVYDRSGQLAGGATIERDLTEFKKLEQQLNVVVESLPAAMLLVDSDGRITLVNKLAETQFGYTREELIGQRTDFLVPERFRSHHSTHKRGFMQEPEVRRLGAGRDLYALRKDGSEFPVEIGLNPVRTIDGLSVVCTIIDISERKQAEAELAERTGQLQRSNEELEQFVGAASHRLLEPLNAVANTIQLIEQNAGDQLDEQSSRHFAGMMRRTQGMQTLVNDLIIYSQIEVKRRPLHPTDSQEVLSRVITSMDGYLRDADAEVVSKGLPIVLADEVQLTHLFQNLIIHAIRYRSEGPLRIEASAEKTNGRWEFRFSDNGNGIDPKHSERIFQIVQLGQESGENEASGLGLPICKRIVERHGGTIRIESNPGGGSTFIFDLSSAKAMQI